MLEINFHSRWTLLSFIPFALTILQGVLPDSMPRGFSTEELDPLLASSEVLADVEIEIGVPMLSPPLVCVERYFSLMRTKRTEGHHVGIFAVSELHDSHVLGC